jgi:heme exporter protein B
LIAHWLVTALPLIVASPVLAILLSMDATAWVRTALALVCGTPSLVAFGAVGAAVTVGLPRGGVLAAVLLVPLSLPVMIFGVGAVIGPAADSALLLLIALSLVSTAFAPFAAALALRTGQD